MSLHSRSIVALRLASASIPPAVISLNRFDMSRTRIWIEEKSSSVRCAEALQVLCGAQEQSDLRTTETGRAAGLGTLHGCKHHPVHCDDQRKTLRTAVVA